ncbi:MAG TPA: glucose-6-phosphate dehydrogenase assembly protein OpcA, partial [Acidimicrobiales bacterium]|nr:glucose-6-phosphate dehydrogenase assembly protein OpcA [Acidimicrobiales bacterium]
MPIECWAQSDTGLGQVLSALSELRRRASGHGASTRTAVMTLVVVGGNGADVDSCVSSVRALGSQHPCRAIVLRPDPDSIPTLDAEACLWRARPPASDDTDELEGGAGHAVFFEELRIHVGGQAASHLASIVGPFALADLPLVLWFPGTLPAPADPLLALASAVLVDTRS